MPSVKHFFFWSLLLLAISPVTKAHDFWLEPEQFQTAAPATVPIKFQVGHKGHTNPWDLRWKRIVALRQYSASGVSDMGASVVPVSKRNSGSAHASIKSAGTVVVGFESYHSTSELSAQRFNEYAEKEGLKLILAHRLSTGGDLNPGREIYSRRAKSIIQAGNTVTDDALLAIGHTLEIVPVTHPYKSTGSDDLEVKLMFKGKALANAKVKLVALDNAEIEDLSVTTDRRGIARFTFPRKGKWMFASVWGVPLEYDDRGEYETYFSSLTIGY